MKKLLLGLFILGSVSAFSLSDECVKKHKGRTHKVEYTYTHNDPKIHAEKVNEALEKLKGKTICSINTKFEPVIITEIIYLED